jgi:hypothetical protein
MLPSNQYLRMKNLFGNGGIMSPQITPDMPNFGPQMGMGTDDMNGGMQPSGMPPPYQMPEVPSAPTPQPMETLPNGGQLPQIAKAASGNPAQEQQPDMAARFKELYQPEHAAIDKYTQLLDKYPDPSAKENRPPWWRAAIGGLQSVSSMFDPRGVGFENFGPDTMKVGMDYVNAPYNNKLAQWKHMTDATKDAANIERQSNVNARSGANQILSQEMREREITRKENADRDRLEIQRGNQRLQAMKQAMPNYVFDNTGPTVTARDRTTGKVVDTGFPTHQLDPLTKLFIEQEGRMEVTAARGANAMDVAEANIKGRQDIVDTRGWAPFEETLPDGTKRTFMYNQATGETRDRIAGAQTGSATPVKRTTGAGVVKPETAQNKRVREYVNARDLRNNRPDLRNFIRLKGGTEFEIAPQGRSFFGYGSPTGPSDAQLEEIKAIIEKGAPDVATPMTSRSTESDKFGNSVQSTNPVQPPRVNMAPSHAPTPPPTPQTVDTPKPTIKAFASHGEPKDVGRVPGVNIPLPSQLTIPEGMVPIYNANGTIAKLVPASQAGTAASRPSKYVVTVE